MSKGTTRSSSSSNISVDSLEGEFRRKASMKEGSLEGNVDTILVPFYEKDVLMKVPKEQKNKKSRQRSGDGMIEAQSSYLVNKQKQLSRRTTYLEMFRKQRTPHQKEKNISTEYEIRSISPEVGGTERESINDEPNPLPDFYNTESYNEIYYEKLLAQDLDYLDNSYEENNEDGGGNEKSPHDVMIENLRSVSEVSQPQRRARRATTMDPPLDNIKLGGLGPDMEKIKPRLERARSLQRYSEKVRMENRVRIYKKSVQADKEKKPQRDSSLSTSRNSEKDRVKKEDPNNASYLVNKNNDSQKKSQILNKLYSSKSADVRKNSGGVTRPLLSRERLLNRPKDRATSHSVEKTTIVPDRRNQIRAKSCTRNKGINTDKSQEMPPVQINFMVNVGGLRPSSALKTLEEKHRMYQEQVKAFNNIGNDNI